MRQVACPPANRAATMFFSWEKKEPVRPTAPGDLEAGNCDEKVLFPLPSPPLGSASVTVVGSEPSCESRQTLAKRLPGAVLTVIVTKLRSHSEGCFQNYYVQRRLLRTRRLHGRRGKESHCPSNTSQRVGSAVPNENLSHYPNTRIPSRRPAGWLPATRCLH